jgi:hypothetical protein
MVTSCHKPEGITSIKLNQISGVLVLVISKLLYLGIGFLDLE